ncbi:hypothetical protein THMIRHAS_20180 [Thiosulfatimonas sediminis]|uniref:DNA polymerase III subunit gamma/tau n=1 Tax=Thiosulfatimonas sediminis TaxID=2675054 RepID=A0A6F8PWZ4_9GAMM|nr:DNA polymerase III subunit gamma/tau [Thiosulfatimonas sediminis]BBP46645.1 hypothetical protein THMIRHAS_20180 [Thiosulfatimonas sediminis]
MSYSVLARKWRPKNFAELVGQQHVMQALANALDRQRLHHAYLFTGTRGVGKTTIARIFAKALNCETGMTSTPCGQCQACRSIDEGRFIDLIEVDAASKTKVDDTREILENVQFAPTQGRYKVYLIDEVHMLSKSSFNALLKTLEEPPEHVKFLLATTEPHKLLNTVLSRCLQFNLMRLTQVQIQHHLQNILHQEQIPFEESALALIAKSADGSARDALSLLDQAIAYGAGKIEFVSVQTMLGLVDQQFVLRILQALAEDSPPLIKAVLQDLALMGVDYDALLAGLSETLHEISYFQLFGEAINLDSLPLEIVQALAQALSAERIQILYQISLLTKQDMQLAPDNRIGFEMGLMRMLAFDPIHSVTVQAPQNGLASSEIAAPVVNAAMPPSEALAALRAGLQSAQESRPAPVALTNAVIPSVMASPVGEVSEVMPSVTPVMQNDFGLSAGEVAPDQSMLASMDPQTAMAQFAPARDLIGKQVTPRKPLAHADHSNPEIQSSPNFLSEQVLAGFGSLGKSDTGDDSATDLKANSASDNLSTALSAQVAKMSGQSLEPIQSSPPLEIFEDHSVSAVELPPVQAVNRVLDDMPPWLTENPSNAAVESMPPSGHSELDVHEPAVQGAIDRLSMTEWPMPTSVVLSSAAVQKMQQWRVVIEQLQLKGMVLEIARQAVLLDASSQSLLIAIDPQQNFSHQENARQQLCDQVRTQLGLDLHFAEAAQFDHAQLTPQQQEQVLFEERQQEAEAVIAADPLLQSFKAVLNMQVLPNSTKPLAR